MGFHTIIILHRYIERDAARMEVIRIEDLDLNDAVKFLKDKRHKKDPDEVYERYVREHVGGRLAFLNRLAKANDLEGKHCGKQACHGRFLPVF